MGKYFIGAKNLEEAKKIARKNDYILSSGRLYKKLSNKQNLYLFNTKYMRRNPNG